jgi:Ala-tRNA(Pro) deacylase
MKYLDDNEIDYSTLLHSPVFSSADHARLAHLPARYIVQTKMMNIDGQFWMAAFSSDRAVRCDLLSALFEGRSVREASAEEILEYIPSSSVDAVPPFGNLYGLRVLADAQLMHGKRIVFSACSRTRSIFMRWIDYERLVHPVVLEFCESPLHFEAEEWLTEDSVFR